VPKVIMKQNYYTAEPPALRFQLTLGPQFPTRNTSKERHGHALSGHAHAFSYYPEGYVAAKLPTFVMPFALKMAEPPFT
jgi:hypothetical protein